MEFDSTIGRSPMKTMKTIHRTRGGITSNNHNNLRSSPLMRGTFPLTLHLVMNYYIVANPFTSAMCAPTFADSITCLEFLTLATINSDLK